jgi:hypothetical protein
MLGVAGGLSIQVGPRRTPAGVAATGAARTLSLGTERHWFPAAVPLDVTAGIAAVLTIFNCGSYRRGMRSSLVLARKPSRRPGRYCICRSRVFTSAVS